MIELDPGGTAPVAGVFVLVELPLPWPHEVGSDPLIAAVGRAATAVVGDRAVRVQAVVGEHRRSIRRAVVFVAADGPLTGYSRLEGAGTVDELPGIVADLLATPPPPVASRVTDVLICTHGSRDRCCGSLGTRLWQNAAGRGARVWRTSHTGGHRFAPSVATFPDGNFWAYVDDSVLTGIVDRHLPSATAVKHLRGCAALTPELQIVDREIFGRSGWDWLDCARIGVLKSRTRAHICYQSPTGEHGCYDACLSEDRPVPIPVCGEALEAPTKMQRQLRVTRLKAWS
jgi:hypothetical protein